MPELRVWVPTYYGTQNEMRAAVGEERPEFGDPMFPVLARPADGLRIVLGSHDHFDTRVPDVQIGRRPRGWAFFLPPLAGCDAGGYVAILDDGRSYVAPEADGGPPPPIKMVSWRDLIEELDKP